MRLHASVLDLLYKTSSPLPSSSPSVSSLLVEPSSRSIALCLADSSYLLFPSFPSPSPSSSPSSPPPTAVPPDSTSAAFLRLVPSGDVLFIAAAPVDAGAAVTFRAWILLLNPPRFEPTCLTHKGSSPATLPLAHGFGVQLAATVNYFALHAPAAGQIWIMGAKREGVEKERLTVDLVKCAVVDCELPIYSIGMSMGVMVLGEAGGIRVFPMRPLVKGNGAKSKMKGRLASVIGGDGLLGHKKPVIPNGLVVFPSSCFRGVAAVEGAKEENADRNQVHRKLICARLKQSSGDFGSFFTDMNFKNAITESIAGVQASVKAISIHVLSQKQFLIMDSAGDLHLLCLRGTFTASEITADPSRSSKRACTSSLDLSMKVQILAVLPTTSSRAELVCISDGKHSVHLMSVDNENPAEKGDNDELEKLNMLSGSAHDRTFSYRTSSSWSRKDICIFHILMISKSWLI
ncbi:hypothetical protein HPP92_009490 [Vanilla planifolia]|uniref:Uncharacterized protein n=1 Tax=Vanilla planifolia TaxID=51239 RepID=A0A835RFY0_VANPL|nr:hypothetical protein HPP92_009490 [Vanilla planifolia]